MTDTQIALQVRKALLQASNSRVPGDVVLLGDFDREEDAAKAYDIARLYTGDSAINFPNYDYESVLRNLVL